MGTNSCLPLNPTPRIHLLPSLQSLPFVCLQLFLMRPQLEAHSAQLERSGQQRTHTTSQKEEVVTELPWDARANKEPKCPRHQLSFLCATALALTRLAGFYRQIAPHRKTLVQTDPISSWCSASFPDCGTWQNNPPRYHRIKRRAQKATAPVKKGLSSG